MKITFGSDPEFMLKDRKGRLVSAIGVIKGTKLERFPLGKHEVYYDNVLAECAIAPSPDKEGVIENFRDCFKRLDELISPLELCVQASGEYPSKECKHQAAQEFGCDPEMCAYDLIVAEAPDVPKGGFRSAGGHVHIGYEGGKNTDDLEKDLEIGWNKIFIVRLMDLFIGIPSLFIDKDPTSPARRQLYGKAGSHRVKEEYGVEYRPLGNFWISSPNLVNLIYDISKFCTKSIVQDKRYEEIEKLYKLDDVREAIDENNLEKGKKLMQIVLKELPKNIKDAVLQEEDRKKPYNFYAEWGL